MEEPTPTTPEITPQMIRLTLKTLESKGLVFYQEGGIYVDTDKGWKLLLRLKPAKEEIIAYGHPNVSAVSMERFLITKSSDVKDGSTIAVRADKSPKEFSDEFKLHLKETKNVEITIEVDEIVEKIKAHGSPALKLTSIEYITISKNDHIDGKTVAILADKSANELSQDLVEKLKNPNTRVKIVFEIKP